MARDKFLLDVYLSLHLSFEFFQFEFCFEFENLVGLRDVFVFVSFVLYAACCPLASLKA